VVREQGPPEDLAELRAVIDEELAKLPKKYREVLVLADLEQKDRRQVAVELGIPEGTVASRLSRARALIASGLTRRGWALPAYLLVVAPAVVPQTLGAAALTRAVAFSTGLSLNPVSGPEALAREVVAAMTRKKLLAVALVVLVGGGIAGLSAAGPGDGPQSSPQSPPRYSVATAGNTALLLDAATGETWVLSPGKEPAWVPVHKAAPSPAATPAPKEAPTPAVKPAPPEPAAKAGPEYTARLVPARSANVAAPTPGVVTRVLVRVGDAVKAGQVLAELNDTEARLGLDAAKVELVRAKGIWASIGPAVAANTISKVEVDRAEADVKAAEVRVMMAEAKLQATRVTAPLDGTVVTLSVSPGEAVGPNSPAVATVSDLRDLHAAFDVSEQGIGQVSVGQACTVKVWAGSAEYEGVVAAIGAVVDPASGTVHVRVRLKVPEGKPAPRPGGAATVRLADPK
jgi:RND family efflux transporter MFP subunit